MKSFCSWAQSHVSEQFYETVNSQLRGQCLREGSVFVSTGSTVNVNVMRLNFSWTLTEDVSLPREEFVDDVVDVAVEYVDRKRDRSPNFFSRPLKGLHF